MNGTFYQKTPFNRSMILCVLWDACRESFYVFGDFYASGAQDAGVTKLLKYTVE